MNKRNEPVAQQAIFFFYLGMKSLTKGVNLWYDIASFVNIRKKVSYEYIGKYFFLA